MKIISTFVLLVIAVATLTACDAGKGPSKPEATSAAQSEK